MHTFEEIVQQEEAILRKVHPEPKDIPPCSTLIDDYLRSFLPGSQIRSLYRYGNLSGTSAGKMEEFMFCLSLKAFSAEERRERWIRRRGEWWARRRMGRSSEDVWELRSTPLPEWTMPQDPDAPKTVYT